MKPYLILKKKYAWFLLLCLLTNNVFINASESAAEEVEAERQRVEDAIKEKQKEETDLLAKYFQDNMELTRQLQEAKQQIIDDTTGMIDSNFKINSKIQYEMQEKINARIDDYNKQQKDLEDKYNNDQQLLVSKINKLQQDSETLASLNAQQQQHEVAVMQKVQSDMNITINTVQKDYGLFNEELLKNGASLDQCFGIMEAAKKYKETINDVDYIGKITPEQAQEVKRLTLESDVIISKAASRTLFNIIESFDEIVNDETIASFKTVIEGVNQKISNSTDENIFKSDQSILQKIEDNAKKLNQDAQNTPGKIISNDNEHFMGIRANFIEVIDAQVGRINETRTDITKEPEPIPTEMKDDLQVLNKDEKELKKKAYKYGVDNKIGTVQKNYELFNQELKGNTIKDDQYRAIIIVVAELRRLINNPDYAGKLIPAQTEIIGQLNSQSKVIIEAAYTKILLRLSQVIDDSNIKNANTDQLIKSVQDVIDQLYGLSITPSNNPTDEEINLIEDGKKALQAFNEKIKNTTKTSVWYEEALLTLKEEIVKQLHGHMENIIKFITTISDDKVLSMELEDMINELKKDQTILQELCERYELDIKIGIKFITKNILKCIDEVDQSLDNNYYDKEKNAQTAQYKIIEDVLFLNKSFDQLSSFKKELEAKTNPTEQEKKDSDELEKIKETITLKITKLAQKSFNNSHVANDVIFQNHDPIKIVDTAIDDVFTKITHRLTSFFKDNNLAIFPFVPQNPSAPTIQEQINYLNGFVEPLKTFYDQYQKDFDVSLKKAQSFDVKAIPDLSDDKTDSDKILDQKYQTFKDQYDQAQSLQKDCYANMADAQSKNVMINTMIAELEGLQLAMNTNSYFLDQQKNSYFSVFITDGKVDGAKIKNTFKIPENPTNDQLLSLGQKLISLAAGNTKQEYNFTDQQKIDAGTLVYNAIKGKSDITDLLLHEMICLAHMYEDYYRNDQAHTNQQAADASRQVVYLLMTAGQLGWQEMRALISGQQDYGQKNNGTTLTEQINNIEKLRTNLSSLPHTTGLVNEMEDCVNAFTLWLTQVQNLIVGQKYLEDSSTDQSVTLAKSIIDDQNDAYDIYAIGFFGAL